MEYMGRTFSVYVKDDELVEKIEKIIDDGRFHNQAHFFTEAAEDKIKEEEDDEMYT